jgi:hypothetical protein
MYFPFVQGSGLGTFYCTYYFFTATMVTRTRLIVTFVPVSRLGGERIVFTSPVAQVTFMDGSVQMWARPDPSTSFCIHY